MTSANTGGQQERVDQLLATVGRMSETDLVALRGYWQGGSAPTRERAWIKVKSKLRSDPRRRILDDARERLASWVSESYLSWRGGAMGSSIIVPGGIDLSALRRDVLPPVLDAAAAIICDEVLDDDEREELLEPIRRVTNPGPVED